MLYVECVLSNERKNRRYNEADEVKSQKINATVYKDKRATYEHIAQVVIQKTQPSFEISRKYVLFVFDIFFVT